MRWCIGGLGALLPFINTDPAQAVTRKQMEMTMDGMANSLVYWTQDLWHAGLFSAAAGSSR